MPEAGGERHPADADGRTSASDGSASESESESESDDDMDQMLEATFSANRRRAGIHDDDDDDDDDGDGFSGAHDEDDGKDGDEADTPPPLSMGDLNFSPEQAAPVMLLPAVTLENLPAITDMLVAVSQERMALTNKVGPSCRGG